MPLPVNFDKECLPSPSLKHIETLAREIALFRDGDGLLRAGGELLDLEFAAARKDSRNYSWQPSLDIVILRPMWYSDIKNTLRRLAM